MKRLKFSKVLELERKYASTTKVYKETLIDFLRPRPEGKGDQSVSVHMGTTTQNILKSDFIVEKFDYIEFEKKFPSNNKKKLDIYIEEAGNKYAIELKNSVDFDTTSGLAHLNRIQKEFGGLNTKAVIVCSNYYNSGVNDKGIPYEGYKFLEDLGFCSYTKFLYKLYKCYNTIVTLDTSLRIYNKQQIKENILKKLSL